jgi:hypothetical protein
MTDTGLPWYIWTAFRAQPHGYTNPVRLAARSRVLPLHCGGRSGSRATHFLVVQQQLQRSVQVELARQQKPGKVIVGK